MSDEYLRGFSDACMDLIDIFIRLQMTSRKMSPEQRVKYLIRWRKEAISYFEALAEGTHAGYIHQVKTKDLGPYQVDIFK